MYLLRKYLHSQMVHCINMTGSINQSLHQSSHTVQIKIQICGTFRSVTVTICAQIFYLRQYPQLHITKQLYNTYGQTKERNIRLLPALTPANAPAKLSDVGNALAFLPNVWSSYCATSTSSLHHQHPVFINHEFCIRFIVPDILAALSPLVLFVSDLAKLSTLSITSVVINLQWYTYSVPLTLPCVYCYC